jgi:hypothetical protein
MAMGHHLTLASCALFTRTEFGSSRGHDKRSTKPVVVSIGQGNE